MIRKSNRNAAENRRKKFVATRVARAKLTGEAFSEEKYGTGQSGSTHSEASETRFNDDGIATDAFVYENA